MCPTHPQTPSYETSDSPILIGKIGAAHGVNGWVNVFSYTEPDDNLLSYHPWLLCKTLSQLNQGKELVVTDSGRKGKHFIVRFEGCDDRNQAQQLTGFWIAVKRSQFPPLPEGEYYLQDLLNFQVLNAKGDILGHLKQWQESSAQNIMEIRTVSGESLWIPWVFPEVVTKVDPAQHRIHVQGYEDGVT